MSRLKGAILRGLGDHRREPWRSFARYCRALQARYPGQGPDWLRWLREAGYLTITLDQIAEEAQAARTVLYNGAGRRARDTARGQLRQGHQRGVIAAVRLIEHHRQQRHHLRHVREHVRHADHGVRGQRVAALAAGGRIAVVHLHRRIGQARLQLAQPDAQVLGKTLAAAGQRAATRRLQVERAFEDGAGQGLG